MKALTSVPFRFDAADHAYFIDGIQVPSVTSLLEESGWRDSTWLTEEGRRRGTAVHELCARFDLGALDVARYDGPLRGWLLAYEKAVSIVRPRWDSIEEARVHPFWRYGCRADRVGHVYGLRAVAELKSGQPHKSDRIQLALQCFVVAAEYDLPAHRVARFAFYPKCNGKCPVVEFTNRRDFDIAREIVRQYCRR